MVCKSEKFFEKTRHVKITINQNKYKFWEDKEMHNIMIDYLINKNLNLYFNIMFSLESVP